VKIKNRWGPHVPGTRPARGYPSDLSERVPGGRGRPLLHSFRQVVNAILCVGRTGCP